jgi:hypothetical protein
MSRPLAFTICANNYLAHASVLAESFKMHHPGVPFIIALLDEPSAAVDYKALPCDEVLWVHECLPELVHALKDTYGIAELCTVVKPLLFLELQKQGYDSILYIDPDIQVFSPFEEVFEALKDHQVVLTPHLCSPTGDHGHPQDKDLMRTGIYNLGFLALNMTAAVLDFVRWWDKRVQAYGYHDLKKGYFYDQIWWGYGPAFLDRVKVLRHLGYNMANWNLHEREIKDFQGQYYVNNMETPLRFFHYSHYKRESRPIIASYNQNFTLENRPDVIPIFDGYDGYVDEKGYPSLKTIPYAFGKKPAEDPSETKRPPYSRIGNIKYHSKQVLRHLLKGEK